MGVYSGGEGTVEISGKHADGTASSLYVEAETNIGYNGGTGTLTVTDGGTATFDSYVMAGGWNGSSGDLNNYTVTGAVYEMVGDDLYWKGTVAAVPEPATTTLSLLALAGLAARRRRK